MLKKVKKKGHFSYVTFYLSLIITSLVSMELICSPTISICAPLDEQIIVDPNNPAWLKYNGGGPFFMCGPGDPEGFLYRGSRNPDGTRCGDQMELIAKLKDTGANCIYLMAVRSHGGDGDHTQNPFVDSDPAKGLDQDILDEWETWFTEMDNNGIVVFFIFYDDSTRIWDTGDSVGSEEKAFIETLVNRFEHHKNLIWCVAEEYQERYSSARIRNIASVIRSADDHEHVIAVHKLDGLSFSEFADDPNINQFAIQYNESTAADLHSGMVNAWNNAAGRYNLNMAEAVNYGTGETARKKNWAIAMGGAYVMILGMKIENTALEDLEDCGVMVRFFESTNFYDMAPHDELKYGGTEFVLALPGDSYIAYASSLSGEIGLKNMTGGTYDFKWLDIANGDTITQEDISVTDGDQAWAKPAGIGNEIVVYIKCKSSSSNVAPIAYDQAVAVTYENTKEIALDYTDPDGPGPYTLTVTEAPANGTVVPDNTGSNDFIYTPKPAFTGVDSFRWNVNDGIVNSNMATVTITVGQETILFSDSFDRPDNNSTVGNGWSQIEQSGAEVGIINNKLSFINTSDIVNRPMVTHSFQKVAADKLVWNFEFDWAMTGPENTYRLFMQLGDRALMSDADQDVGVGVNLIWTSINGVHESLCYRQGGDVTTITALSGRVDVTVMVDLDKHTYEVVNDGSVVQYNVPFDNLVDLDMVRFFADALNDANFAGRSFDELEIRMLSSESSENRAPTAEGQSVITTKGTPLNITLSYSDPDGPGPYTFAIIESPSHGLLSDDNGDELVVYTSDASYAGMDSFTWKVNDGLEDSNIKTVAITVNLPFQLVISDLTVASGTGYEIIENGLNNGAPVYIDRTYTFASVPPSLLGATYIKTANADKGLTGDSFMSFDVNQDVTVYVAHDNRIATKPSWMESFADTGDDLVTTDTTLSIFAKHVSAGTVTLGGNEVGYSMYVAIIVAQGTPLPTAPTGLSIVSPE